MDTYGNSENEKDTYIIEYFNELKSKGKILDVVIRLRSAKDIDIVVKVQDSKVKITKILIESDLYIKPKLNADIVNRRREKILLLTKDKKTYEISVLGELEFDKQYKLAE